MKRWLLAATLCAAAGWAQADLVLVPEQSSLQFVSIKKGSIGELGQFSDLRGRVEDDGTVSFTVGLGSVDTAIAIRDDRLRQFLFQTEQFPQAEFTAQLDEEVVGGLVAGERRRVHVNGTLALHGRQAPLSAELELVGTDDGGIMVQSAKPVLVQAESFGLLPGIDKLKELAGLPSIATAIPVTFTLVFHKTED